jgi:hypothetical protein
MAIYTIMNKAIYKSLILLASTMLMACQGVKGNAPSKETAPKETVKQEATVLDISCTSMTISLPRKHRCCLMH